MKRPRWITTGVLAVAMSGMWGGCDLAGSTDLAADRTEHTSVAVDELAAGARTPPANPDNDERAAECLSQVALDTPDGRVHNRFLWCKRATIHVRPWIPAFFGLVRETVGSLDAEYSIGHVVVRGEAVASRWDVPFQNGDPTLPLDALGTSLETRVALTPRWSMAVRGDRLGFSRVTAANGVVRTWDANVLRVEGAVGYLVRRNVRLKAGYQYNWRDGGRERSIGMVGAQLLYWF